MSDIIQTNMNKINVKMTTYGYSKKQISFKHPDTVFAKMLKILGLQWRKNKVQVSRHGLSLIIGLCVIGIINNHPSLGFSNLKKEGMIYAYISAIWYKKQGSVTSKLVVIVEQFLQNIVF